MSGRRTPDPRNGPGLWCRAAVPLAVAAFSAAASAPAQAAPRTGWLAACAGPRQPGGAQLAGAVPEGFWADVLPWRVQTAGSRQGAAVPVPTPERASAPPASGAPNAGSDGEASRRLAGLAFPVASVAEPDRDAIAMAWDQRRDVSIVAAGPADRWGRLPLLAFAGGDLLNAALLRAGLAVFRSGDLPFACARLLQGEEEAGRRARRGIWAGAAEVLPAEHGSEILAREGRFTLVEGRVRSVGQTKTRFYLNFGTVRSQDFAIAVEKRNLRKFEASGMTGMSWEGRRVRVRGIVVQAGGPLIEVSSPEDVERLE